MTSSTILAIFLSMGSFDQYIDCPLLITITTCVFFLVSLIINGNIKINTEYRLNSKSIRLSIWLVSHTIFKSFLGTITWLFVLTSYKPPNLVSLTFIFVIGILVICSPTAIVSILNPKPVFNSITLINTLSNSLFNVHIEDDLQRLSVNFIKKLLRDEEFNSSTIDDILEAMEHYTKNYPSTGYSPASKELFKKDLERAKKNNESKFFFIKVFISYYGESQIKTLKEIIIS